MNVVNAGMVGMAAARTWDGMRHGEDGGTQSPLVELGRGPESGGNIASYCSRQLNFGESILDTLGPLISQHRAPPQFGGHFLRPNLNVLYEINNQLC